MAWHGGNYGISLGVRVMASNVRPQSGLGPGCLWVLRDTACLAQNMPSLRTATRLPRPPLGLCSKASVFLDDALCEMLFVSKCHRTGLPAE